MVRFDLRFHIIREVRAVSHARFFQMVPFIQHGLVHFTRLKDWGSHAQFLYMVPFIWLHSVPFYGVERLGKIVRSVMIL